MFCDCDYSQGEEKKKAKIDSFKTQVALPT